MSNKKKIILYGYLKELYPHEIEVEADTVAEALNFLSTIEELKPEPGKPHPVRVDGIERESELHAKREGSLEIHVRPRIGGAGGRGGLLQILLGVVLVAVGIMFPAGLSLLGTTISQSTLFLTGGLMITGGLLQLLMPTPKMSENKSSRNLGGSVNTTEIGTPIALGYGYVKWGGQYLSFDADAKDFGGDSEAPPDEIFGPDAEEQVFIEHDKYTLPDGWPPLLPVYDSPTPGPSNLPTSAWIT